MHPAAWLCLVTAPLCCGLDLTSAVVALPENASARERKAVTMLVEEAERRSQVRWPLVRWPAQGPGVNQGPVIRVVNRHTGPREGYSLRLERESVNVEGNDERGVLFGVGRLLRELRIARGSLAVPDGLSITTAPQYPMRGHQLGYRPKTNSYDGWTLGMWEQYIRDLAVFGTNAIELIPPRSDDAADSPLFPLPPMQTMVGMSRLADEYGLDVWIWYPALDKDYSDPKTVEFALNEWAEVFKKLPRIDAVFVPGGDPGHTQPKFLMALLEKQAASLRRLHPKAQMWVAPQGFDAAWMDEFYGIVRAEPAWLNGIVFGPQVRVSLAALRAAIPKRYPIRHYPDITHTLRCQYPVPDWDHAYAVTLQREPVNPRPLDQARIFRALQGLTVGFITYSEGCNDDVNKIVWSALGWDPEADVTGVLREYSRYFIGEKFREGFAQGLLALERNWRGPLAVNEGVYTTLNQFRSMDHEAAPGQLWNWRFQQAQYRAHYDAYQRRRLLYETDLEAQALERLGAAAALGSLRAMREAEEILDRVAGEGVARAWRGRVFELAEALFQSIRMQLSVEWYKAIGVGRGANLDLIDSALNNRGWLKARFETLRALATERARMDGVQEILNWTNPGPGGFYDDLGNPARQPHLVREKRYEEDPAYLVTPLVGFNVIGGAGWRVSWQNHAEALNDAVLRMRYRDLDPGSGYKVRITYAGENVPAQIRLLALAQAGAQREVHGWRKKDFPVKPVEFAVPAEATRGGELELVWEKEKGLGGAGRGLQVAEVWLVRTP
ncbi:MAG: hypothetical protein JJE04_01830 [Acidobacteriia bacterium]|nr:hypothetical protein [Terriglobia bacterium]